MFSKILLTFFILQAALVLCIFAEKIEKKEAALLAARNYTGKSFEQMGSFADGSSSCSDVLGAPFGTISYKNFQNAAPNERCVWVVRVPGVTTSTEYYVSIVGLGIPSSVIIQGFTYRGVLVNTIIPTTASDFVLTNTSILVITFHTGPTVSGRGFSLQYSEYTWDEGTSISSSSEDIVAPANTGHIKYPAGTKSSYENYELSPFVLIPVPGSNVSAGFKMSDVVYIRDGLEGCWDSLKVYTFDRNLATVDKWRFQGEICGGVDSEVITNNDLILILFQSDHSNVGSGFHLYSTAN